MTGYPCCCHPEYPCAEDCSPGVPDTISITITGAADDNCGLWANIDGTYTLTRTHCTSWSESYNDHNQRVGMTRFNTGDSCHGAGPFGGYSAYFLYLTVRFEGDTIRLYIQPVGYTQWILSETHIFSAAVTRPVDCCAWLSTLVLAYESRTKSQYNGALFGGDLSAATVLGSAVTGCPGP